MDVKDKKILVIGQLKTSRTETLEEYFLKKVKKLGVIGLMSPFATHSESRCSLFENGEKVKEFCLPSFSIKSVKWWNRPLMSISFALYVWATFFAGLRLKEKFDLCVGVATFPSLLAILLKKIKKVNKVIYYCLDYYPPPPKFSFNSFIYPIYKALDRWLIKRVDVVWELTPRIAQAREIFAGIPKNSYPQQIVPLGYADYVQRKLNVEEREEWTLGFVGTLTENQGLQMVITAMPKLIKKFPKIKVRVIGHGPYAPQLKQMVKENGMEDHFIFHGFVKDDEEVFDILSRCMVGLATWTGDKADNSLYADPGKPKLYALLDLPIIITSAPWVAKLISDLGAGEMINYDVDNFVDTVERLFSNKERVQSYLEGIQKFRPYCLAENIFNTAFEEAKHIDKIQEDVSVSRFRKERMQNKEAEKEFYDNLNQSIARVDVDAEHQVKHQEDVLDRAIKFIERQLDLSSLVNVNILEVGSDGMFTSALRKSYPNLTINSFLGDIAFAQLKNFKDDIECSKVNLDLEFLPFQTGLPAE